MTLKLTLTFVIKQCIYIGVFEGQNLKFFGYCLVLNCEIHQKVFIHVNIFNLKVEYKENYLALTSLKIP